METKLKLTPAEKLFWLLSAGYSLLCLLFYFFTEKGREVVFLSENYSQKLNVFFSYITQFAEWEGIVFMIVIMGLTYKRNAIIFVFSFGIETIITQSSKFFFALERPRAWAQMNSIALPPDTSDLLHNSFPSGHTALIFCMAYCLVLSFNNWKWTIFFFAVALLVCFSRIYLMAHFVIDTGAGAMIGCLAGFTGFRIYEYHFPKNR